MKKSIWLIAILFAAFFTNNAGAQVSFHVNLGVQPLWGPTGYDYAQYYYIPDIDAYYDVANQDYVYNDGGRWVTSTYLPPQYADFDLYGAHKVVINAANPWLRNDYYRGHYSMYRGRHDQHVIRDSREQRYWANPQHPHHDQWHGDNPYGRGYQRQKEWNGYRPHNEGHGNEGHGNGGHGNEGHGDEHGHGRHD